MNRRRAFTLVELLVVIGVVAVLMGILLPTLAAVRERAQRTVCAARLKQLIAAVHLYANENRGKLPAGSRDGERMDDSVCQAGEHCVWLSHAAYELFVQSIGNPHPGPTLPLGQNPGDPALACPNLRGDRELPEEAEYQTGWLVGYNYLGGHRFIPPQHRWKSPMKISDSGRLAVWSDLNDWSPAAGWTIASHQRRGGGYFHGPKGGQHPRAFAAAGGNVAYLDGSVSWRDLAAMDEYLTSDDGANYLGLW